MTDKFAIVIGHTISSLEINEGKGGEQITPAGTTVPQKARVWIGLTYRRFIHSFFLQEQFYKNKTLDFVKICKNKLRAKPGLLSHKTWEQSV